MHARFHITTVEEKREFTCASCGVKRWARVFGQGEGAATDLNAAGTGSERALADAKEDVRLTLAIATCPACGHRDADAVRNWWWEKAIKPVFLILGLIAVVSVLIVKLAGDAIEADASSIAAVVAIVALVLLGITVPLAVLPKWSSAKARVTWE